MNDHLCKRLKDDLAAMPEPQVITAARFFDGNDDPGSIGCNLDQHPGVEAFRDVFAALLHRSDVHAVYVQISEADPGEGSWPFTDTVFVVGSISIEILRNAVQALHPTDVGRAPGDGNLPSSRIHQGAPVSTVWWD